MDPVLEKFGEYVTFFRKAVWDEEDCESEAEDYESESFYCLYIIKTLCNIFYLNFHWEEELLLECGERVVGGGRHGGERSCFSHTEDAIHLCLWLSIEGSGVCLD